MAQFPALPPIAIAPGDWTKLFQHLRVMATTVNRMLQGKLNATLNVTLDDFEAMLFDDETPMLFDDGTVMAFDSNSSGTVIEDARLTSTGAGVFDPMTANAAAELGAGTLYVTSANRRDGRWTTTHAANGQADRTFRLIMVG